MVVIEPSFEIDEKNRVICQSHSRYLQFLKPKMNSYEELIMEKQLTCKLCDHYINDDCYFPRAEIDKIEFDRLNRARFQCNLCGNKIDLMLTIMQKIYFEVKFNTVIPLICCSCYQSLEEKKYITNNLLRILLSILFYLPIIVIASMFVRLTLISILIAVLVGILLKIIIKQKTHYSFFIYDLIRGIRFYKKLFRDRN